MNVRRSIASRDALDFHPAWAHPSCGDCLDHRHRDAHHGGWPVRKPDHAEHFWDLLPECFLGASRPGTLREEQSRARQAAADLRRELEIDRKTWVALHPLQKMVISQRLPRKIHRKRPLRRRITKCPRGIARCFSSLPGWSC